MLKTKVLRYGVTYLATMLVMLLLDTLWIGFIAADMYQSGIGHLMATAPNLIAAAIFYGIFIVGLMLFAIIPATGIKSTLVLAGLYGFFTYSTYEFTNMATLKSWPVEMSIIDIAWGVFISAASAMVGKLVLKGFKSTP